MRIQTSIATSTMTLLWMATIQLFLHSSIVSSFMPSPSPSHAHPKHIAQTMRNSPNLFAKKQSSSEFELQELRAQFQAMLNQNVRPKMLKTEKRNEIENYVGNVLLNCPSPIPLKNLADDGASVLHGNWTLVFASENAALGDLPQDSTVQFSMYPEYKCDYKIKFAKALGLKSLTAKSTYIVDSSPVNPGLVTFIYQDIVTDVFGFKSLPVGLFGMLKGRANYVETIWFDGKLWVERGYSIDGKEFFNVYIKE